MSDYRHAYVPGGTFFLTIVTHLRQPRLESSEDVARLRLAIKQVMEESPFDLTAAVVLPDHAHFLWSLPRGDSNYSARVGRMKILFTRSVRELRGSPVGVSQSRRKHRESDVWQRRFWEHVVEDEEDFEQCLNHIHYNPVKHEVATCPHLWPFSSFQKWVELGQYTEDWGCSCQGRPFSVPENVNNQIEAGE